MLDWIIENKEWLFSGIGISLFTLLVLGSKLYLQRKQNTAQKAEEVKSPFDMNLYSDRPYPSEIRDELDKTPPLQENAKRDNYIGLKITWLTTLENTHTPNPDGEIRLMLLDRGNYPWVYCNVNINKYPELKIAHPKSEIWIAGEITKVTGGTVEVKVNHLKLH